jgi:hypothetical protein
MISGVQKTKPIHRLTGADATNAAAILEKAALLVMPEDQTQRRFFGELMPQIYVLRRKNWSWPQITDVLINCGFKLATSTTKGYFYEFLAERMDACQEKMTEQILVMADVRGEIRSQSMEDAKRALLDDANKKRTPVHTSVESDNDKTTAIDKIPSGADRKYSDELPKVPVAGHGQQVEKSASGTDRKNSDELPKVPVAGHGQQVEKSASGADRKYSDELPKVPVAGHGQQVEKSASGTDRKNSDELPKVPLLVKEEVGAVDKKVVLVGCGPLVHDAPKQQRRIGIPDTVFEVGMLEHPAVPGLLLSKDERVYGLRLNFIDKNGFGRQETINEHRFRVLWQQPIKRVETKTDPNFVVFDKELFSHHR